VNEQIRDLILARSKVDVARLTDPEVPLPEVAAPKSTASGAAPATM
jgi:hypothetical protein